MAEPGTVTTRAWLAPLPSAARAAIVMPAVFAFSDKVIGRVDTATFAAFGSFAVLVLVEFTGPPRKRLTAYTALGLAGAAFVVVGTLCSRSPWLATLAMAVVGSAVLFSGVISGYFAAASTAALLSFVLAAVIQAPATAVPARLEGWLLAAVVGTGAQMLLWPAYPVEMLRDAAARACDALADLTDPAVDADGPPRPARLEQARLALRSMRQRFRSAPSRPTGLTEPTMALGSLVDELDWLASLVLPTTHPRTPLAERDGSAESLAASAAVLRTSATRLRGRRTWPDLERLHEAREAAAHGLVAELVGSSAPPEDGQLPPGLDEALHARFVSISAERVAGYALRAGGDEAPPLRGDLVGAVADPPSSPGRFTVVARRATAYADVRSVWLRNTVRGAAGLAIAVLVAQLSDLQHAFWIVLGTLSVLRSNALGTGSSILRALYGTAVGIVVGSLLLIGIGSHQPVLWAVLPLAVFVAAYAPRAISFAAGQAGFTVVVIVLFNLIRPVGWKVGLVRIEDVAIGFAVSLGVGILFWPRGADALVRQNLAAAYTRGTEYVVAATRPFVTGQPSQVDDAARATQGALDRLDASFRQYLVERSEKAMNNDRVASLVTGAARLRHVAQSLSSLGAVADVDGTIERCGRNLEPEVQAAQAWYLALAGALVRADPVPPAPPVDGHDRRRLLECIQRGLTCRDEARIRPALALVLTSRTIDQLERLESHLAGRDAGPV